MEMKIGLRKDPPAYGPGEEIAGGVQWLLDKPPKTVEVRLLWRTGGQAVEDVAVVDTVSFESPQADDTRSFTFTAPEAPYSFAGSLFSLKWAIELIALPHNECQSVYLVVAPGGNALQLGKFNDE